MSNKMMSFTYAVRFFFDRMILCVNFLRFSTYSRSRNVCNDMTVSGSITIYHFGKLARAESRGQILFTFPFRDLSDRNPQISSHFPILSLFLRRYGRKQPRIQTEVLGHSLVHLLAHSLRSLPRSWDSE